MVFLCAPAIIALRLSYHMQKQSPSAARAILFLLTKENDIEMCAKHIPFKLLYCFHHLYRRPTWRLYLFSSDSYVSRCVARFVFGFCMQQFSYIIGVAKTLLPWRKKEIFHNIPNFCCLCCSKCYQCSCSTCEVTWTSSCPACMI